MARNMRTRKKISAGFEDGMAANCEFHAVLADLFHALSQPLTTLQCCLSGSLTQPRSGAGYRRDLRTALQQAKSAASLTGSIRELVGCEVGNHQLYHSDLGACVKEVVDDLFPVAESGDVELKMRCHGSCPVQLEANRLRRTIFGLIESAVSESRPGSRISVCVIGQGNQIGLTIRTSAAPARKLRFSRKNALRNFPALHTRVALAIARRTFESIGGSFHVQRGARQTLTIRLPRSSQEPALPLAGSSPGCG
jgi:hypothetical protein